MTFLVDTNVIRELLRNHPKVMAESEAAAIAGGVVAYSAISRGETRFGLDRLPQGKRRQAIERAVELVLDALGPALPVDAETADSYGRIKASLERAGRPIPDNDIWLAATALRHGCVLVTADAHFDAVDGLPCVNWLNS